LRGQIVFANQQLSRRLRSGRHQGIVQLAADAFALVIGVDGELAKDVDRFRIGWQVVLGIGGTKLIPDRAVLFPRAPKGVPDNLPIKATSHQLKVSARRVELDQALPELIWMEPRIVHLVVMRRGVHRQDLFAHLQSGVTAVTLNNQAAGRIHAVEAGLL
jgi:hypothetical protein